MRWKRGITLGFVFSISMVKVNVKDNDTNRDPRWVNETTTIKTLKAQQFSERHAVKNPRDTFTGRVLKTGGFFDNDCSALL